MESTSKYRISRLDCGCISDGKLNRIGPKYSVEKNCSQIEGSSYSLIIFKPTKGKEWQEMVRLGYDKEGSK